MSSKAMIDIRPMKPDDHSGVLAVAEALPEWFDADARGRGMPADLQHQDGFVVLLDGKLVGFITLFVADGRLNIGWLGVKRDCQRQGIGGLLLDAAEDAARDMGIEELATRTLGDSVDYQPYEQTRAFYAKHGFRIYQKNKTDNPGCPEEIRILKKINH